MPTGQNEKLRLTCPCCDKTYRIRRMQIPPGSTAVRCKACGKRVKLKLDFTVEAEGGGASCPAPKPDTIVEKASLAAPRCRLDLMTEEKRLRPRRKIRSKKPWGF